MARRKSARALLLALLALAHIGLWLWVDGGLHRQPVNEPSHRTQMRLLSVRLPPLIKPAPALPPVRPRPRQDLTPRRSVMPVGPVEMPSPSPALAETREAETATPAPAPAAREPLLLNTDATRRALRQAAREPLLAERAASAMGDGAALRPEDKLGQQIQQAATTDCLKGEFLGGGAGLLSLPFWLLAEARGKCRR